MHEQNRMIAASRAALERPEEICKILIRPPLMGGADAFWGYHDPIFNYKPTGFQ
jgi:hypothetical protein